MLGDLVHDPSIAHTLSSHIYEWLSQWLIANIYLESVYEGNKAVLVSQYGLFSGTVFCLSSFPQPGHCRLVSPVLQVKFKKRLCHVSLQFFTLVACHYSLCRMSNLRYAHVALAILGVKGHRVEGAGEKGEGEIGKGFGIRRKEWRTGGMENLCVSLQR